MTCFLTKNKGRAKYLLVPVVTDHFSDVLEIFGPSFCVVKCKIECPLVVGVFRSQMKREELVLFEHADSFFPNRRNFMPFFLCANLGCIYTLMIPASSDIGPR